MKTKKIIANEAIRFTRILKVSFWIALIIFAVLYSVVFEIYKTENPDLSGVDIKEKEFTQNSFEINRETNQIETHKRIEYNRIAIYGNEFNIKVIDFYTKDHILMFNDKDELKRLVYNAIISYRSEKTKESILYSLTILLGIPLISLIFRCLTKTITSTVSFVETNKTI
jgi:hypothetical protein